jgi:hypothetical protein
MALPGNSYPQNKGKLYQSEYGWEMGHEDGSTERGDLVVGDDLVVRFRPDGIVIPPATVGPEVGG